MELTDAAPEGPAGTGPSADDLPIRARVLIAGTAIGAVGVLLTVLLTAGALSVADGLAWLLLTVAFAASELFQFEVPSKTERITYSTTDAIWTAAILLAEPVVVVWAVAVGVLVGQSIQAWTPVKVAFNAAQMVLGIGAALLVYQALGSPPVTTVAGWVAIALGMAAFQLVNTLLMAALLAILVQEPFWRTVRDPSALLHWVGNLAIGILAALLWTVAPAALPLLLVPLALTFLAYRGWLRSTEERTAMRGMARDADVISRSSAAGGRLTLPTGLQDARSLALTLNGMLDRLDAAFQRERRFIRETSHELRTPITICRGHLELLGPEPTAAELDEAVEIVLDELDRMARIVEDMNTLARMEDPASVRAEAVDISAVLDDVAAKAAPLTDGRLEVPRVHGAGSVRADRQRLTQALINLVTNAVQHTPPGTAVRLRVHHSPARWRFEVDDDGGGVPAAEADAVFLPFRTGASPASGNGLGLAIVSGIARAHGGSAGLDNRPGAGATFWLEIPR